jgi:hypothetical protein
MMTKPSLVDAEEAKGMVITDNFEGEPLVGEPLDWDLLET